MDTKFSKFLIMQMHRDVTTHIFKVMVKLDPYNCTTLLKVNASPHKCDHLTVRAYTIIDNMTINFLDAT